MRFIKIKTRTVSILVDVTSDLLSFHCCLNVIWTLNSILTSSIFSKLRTNKLTNTVVGPSEPSLELPFSSETPLGLKLSSIIICFVTNLIFSCCQPNTCLEWGLRSWRAENDYFSKVGILQLKPRAFANI